MEQKLLFLINREWTNPVLDRLMALASSFSFWFAPLLATIALSLIFGRFRARAMLVVLALVIAVSDGVVADSLKKIVRRPRPHEVLADVRRVDLRRAKPAWMALFKTPKVELSRPGAKPPGGRSFPSAHTMNNFAAAVVLSAFYRRAGTAWFAVAAVVGYSRIYVGAHWPSDIATSMALGAGCALLLVALLELIWRKAAPRLLPRTFARHGSLLGIAAP